jgi:hypothetical protein
MRANPLLIAMKHAVILTDACLHCQLIINPKIPSEYDYVQYPIGIGTSDNLVKLQSFCEQE